MSILGHLYGKKYDIKSAPPAIPFTTPVIGMSQIPSSIRFERHAWESAVSRIMIRQLKVCTHLQEDSLAKANFDADRQQKVQKDFQLSEICFLSPTLAL